MLRFCCSPVADPRKLCCLLFSFDRQNTPRVNIIESVCGIERFLDAIDCTGEFKSMSFLAGLLTPHMSPSVDLVVADGACEAMLEILESKYPW